MRRAALFLVTLAVLATGGRIQEVPPQYLDAGPGPRARRQRPAPGMRFWWSRCAVLLLAALANTLAGCGGAWDPGTGEMHEDRARLVENSAWPVAVERGLPPRWSPAFTWACRLLLVTDAGLEFEVLKPTDQRATGCGYPAGSRATVRFIVQQGEPRIIGLFFDEAPRW